MNIIGQVAFCSVCALIIARFAMVTAKKRPERGIISALSCMMYIICLFTSAKLQSVGFTSTKLMAAHVLRAASPSEIGDLSLHWAIELFVILISEIFSTQIWLQNRTGKKRLPLINPRYSKYIHTRSAVLLIAIGIISVLVFRTSLEDRADGGQGAITILKTCLVVGVSILAFNNFFAKKIYYLLGIFGIFVIALGSVRSPLLSVAIAFFAGKLARRELTPPMMLKFLGLGLLLSILGATMSIYRSDVIQGRPADLSDALLSATQNPFVAIYGAGIDTLDGYRLTAEIAKYEPARPFNVLVAITTFVPRAIWPNKPSDLSLDITSRYLGWKQGGIFLSLVGYLRIAFGGYIQSLIALAFISSAISAFYKLKFQGFSGFVAILITFRLLLGGSPFDVYYGLVYVMLYGAASIPFSAYWFLSKPKKTPRARINSTREIVNAKPSPVVGDD